MDFKVGDIVYINKEKHEMWLRKGSYVWWKPHFRTDEICSEPLVITGFTNNYLAKLENTITGSPLRLELSWLTPVCTKPLSKEEKVLKKIKKLYGMNRHTKKWVE